MILEQQGRISKNATSLYVQWCINLHTLKQLDATIGCGPPCGIILSENPEKNF